MGKRNLKLDDRPKSARDIYLNSSIGKDPLLAAKKRFKKKFGFWPTEEELAMNIAMGTIK